jgi:hydroxyisourate hydrolase
MTGYLTTHVLDTAAGSPVAGLRVALYRIEGAARVPLAEAITNADGRTDAPILPAGAFEPGTYELEFQAGAYLHAAGRASAFLDVIPIRFTMDAQAHYHVPLLLSPYGYSTYRGS